MKKADLFLNYLREEGYVPKLDDDGNVVFKAEGLTLVVFAAEDDEAYFQVVMPNFWSIENAEGRERAIRAANEVTAQMKVGKIQVVNDIVTASVELLLDPIESFMKVFPRCVQIVLASARKFGEAMQILH